MTYYIAELKELSRFCDFGKSEGEFTPQLVLEDNLRDRFVCGLGESRIQRRLLSETVLTYQEAITIANAMELADMGTSHITGKSTQVHAIATTPTRKKKQPHQKFTDSTTNRNTKPCYRCSGAHKQEQCPFKGAECFKCKKIGHISKMCKSNKKIGSKDSTVYDLNNMKTRNTGCPPITVNVSIADTVIKMEVDTGASAITLITMQTMKLVWPKKRPYLCTDTKLVRTYTGETVPVLGTMNIDLRYQKRRAAVTVIVVESDGPNLLGRDGIVALKLKWSSVHQLQQASMLDAILKKHTNVFSDELGLITGVQATFNIDPSVKPRFMKARPVPYALRKNVTDELNRLETEGIIERVTHSEWAAPIVPVLKTNGQVRLCGDFRTTVNMATNTQTHPIPKIEDIYSTLSGGSVLSKLDCSNAYLQYPLHVDSRKYTTINTSAGLFRYTRLPFGVSSSPAIFQRVMDSMLKGIPGVCVYLDDILVSGTNDSEHRQRLDRVLEILSSRGLRLCKDKCSFGKTMVQYLGHMIDGNGLHPLNDKIKSISAAPAPKNVTELKSFLGMLQFYSRFLDNLATTIEPLTRLLRKNCVFSWGNSQQQAFNRAKKMLLSHSVLVHFDPSKEIVLSCDASPYGVGAVLAHVMSDGTERPIAYYSRSLAPAEKNYSQLDKEALAIICAVNVFISIFMVGNLKF